jgi:protein TonB
LKFNYFIIASVLIHLLFIGLMSMTHSNTEKKETVFNVNIIPPLETKKAFVPKKRALKKDPLPERKPVIVKRRRRPVDLDNSVKPDVIFDEGLGKAQKEPRGSEMKEDSGKPKGLDSGRAEKKAVPSGIRDNDRSGIDGPALSPGDFLFDKETIEKYASKGYPDGVGVEDGKGLMFYAPEFKNRAYMRMLRDRIESIWKYPKEAARRRLTGDLYIKFSIRKNGKLDKIELVRTSGYRALDEAAMQALKKAEPYWPLPENYDKEVLEITGHFVYVIGATL